MKGLFEQVYQLVQKIPKGKVVTYGEVARMLGLKVIRKVGSRKDFSTSSTMPSDSENQRDRLAQVSPQLVGWALHANRDPSVPCHRVVNKAGRLAPNFVFNGAEEQKRRLEAEGVEFKDDMHVDLVQCNYTFPG